MIACGGDALIDFVPVPTASGEDGFVPRCGGSCLNIAVALSRLGTPTTFIGGISTDLFGEMLADHLDIAGVSLAHATRSADETTLAFVKMDGNDARYAFYDEHSAGRRWVFDPATLPAGLDALHVGSVTLNNDPSASAYESMVAHLHRDIVISLDPNCRPTLVADDDAYRARIGRIAAHTHIVRLSEEDFEYLYPGATEDEMAARLLDGTTALFVITRGPNGATGWNAAGRLDVPGVQVDVVDTIGAGDTFQGALLHRLRSDGHLDAAALAALSHDALGAAMRYAVKAAGITCTRVGCDPPTHVD